MKSPHLLIVLAVLNLPVYVVLFRRFFDDWEEVDRGLAYSSVRWLDQAW